MQSLLRWLLVMPQIGLQPALLVPKDLSGKGLAQFPGVLRVLLILARSHVWHLCKAKGQQLPLLLS